MRKYLCFICIFWSFNSAVCANDLEREEFLVGKVVLQDASGYFSLSDKSFFKVVGYAKRWRSIVEWWNNVELIPQNYECLPNDWYPGATVRVYSKSQNLNVDESNASNQEVLRQCTHLLVNVHTGGVLFGIALEPAECMVRLFDDAYKESYSKAFNKGLSQGRNESCEDRAGVYNEGYGKGYQVGFADGYNACQRGEVLR